MMSFRRLSGLRLALAGALLLAAQPASALEDGASAYPRGYRDLAAGLIPAEPGVHVRDDLLFYQGSLDDTQQGGAVTIDADLGLAANVARATIVTGWQPFGLTQAFGVSWVQAATDLDARFVTPAGNSAPAERTVGVGDLAVTPLLLGWDRGNWHGNAGVAVWIPVGSYEADRFVNAGRNYWSVGPHLALSWIDTDSGWDLSAAALYMHNFENNATGYDSGDVLHGNFYAGNQVTPWLKAGAAGYAMLQVTDDRGGNAPADGFRARVFALGPALRFGFGADMPPLLVKYYREFGADNTFEGDLVSVGTFFRF